MKRRILFWFLCFSNNAFGVSWFMYDRAAYAAQQGDWNRSAQLLAQKLVDKPHNPTLLYDAGVAAYRCGEHAQAVTYFERAAAEKTVLPDVQEKAYFNAGNAYVALHELKKAINSYEKALELDPHDEHARHNLEKVKKMLEEEQKKKQQQNQSDDQKNEQVNADQQEEKNKDNKQDSRPDDSNAQQDKQQNQAQKNDGNKNQQDKSQKKEQQGAGDQNKQDQSKQSENQNAQERQGGNQDKDQQSKEGTDQQKQKSIEQQRQNQKDSRSQEQSQEGQKKRSNQAEKDQKKELSQQKNESANAHSSAEQNVADEKQADPTEQLGASLKRLLKAQEENDAENNKAFIQAMVGAQMAGSDGQQCW